MRASLLQLAFQPTSNVTLSSRRRRMPAIKPFLRNFNHYFPHFVNSYIQARNH